MTAGYRKEPAPRGVVMVNGRVEPAPEGVVFVRDDRSAAVPGWDALPWDEASAFETALADPPPDGCPHAPRCAPGECPATTASDAFLRMTVDLLPRPVPGSIGESVRGNAANELGRRGSVTGAQIVAIAQGNEALPAGALAVLVRAAALFDAALLAEREACVRGVEAFAADGEDFVSVERVVDAIRARGSK